MAESNEKAETFHEDTQTGRMLTFFLGRETFGIEIRYVTEIIVIQNVTEIPEMPDYVKGIINLRGSIIPLLDVRLRFKKEPRDYDDRTCIIVIDLNGISAGLIVDSVSEVLTIPDEDFSELPEIHTGPSRKYVKKIGKISNGVILLLDSEKLISENELLSLNGAHL